jgi:hypothetical protein
VNRDSIIKGLAILASVALVLFIGFSIVRVFLNASQKAEVKAEGATPATLDANAELKATIDSLESSWQVVQSRQFATNQDPLYLGRVIKNFQYAKTGAGELEEDDVIRLTATVVDDDPKAIIKYNGKSYVVQRGEWIEKVYRVASIDTKEVVLESGGSRMVLRNKPVQELEPEGAESDYSNNYGSGTENY